MKNIILAGIAAFVLLGCNSGCGGTIPSLEINTSPEGVSVDGSGDERSVSVEAYRFLFRLWFVSIISITGGRGCDPGIATTGLSCRQDAYQRSQSMARLPAG